MGGCIYIVSSKNNKHFISTVVLLQGGERGKHLEGKQISWYYDEAKVRVGSQQDGKEGGNNGKIPF